MKTKLPILSIFCILHVFLFQNEANACTNIIVTPGASKDGSALVSYAADSHMLYGELYFHKAGIYKKNSFMDVFDWDSGKYLGKIPQVARTFQTVGNINEHQLIITETTFGGRSELHDPDGKMDYGSMIYITLQRAKTAREAISVMTALANENGYFSSGETFTIADKNEVWIMEVIGKGSEIKDGKNIRKGIVWVARRVPDGYVCAHANQSRITKFPLNDPENCLYSPDVISFAREKGYFNGEDKDFSFRDAYCPLEFSGLRACEARVWSAFNMAGGGKFIYDTNDGKEIKEDASAYLDYAMGYNADNNMPLWIKPSRKLSVKDVADMMRDHYEGTPMDMRKDIGGGGNALPYRWRPMTFEHDGKTYINERAIATQQTGFWFVAQARASYPDLFGGIIWFGTDDAATSYLTPIYANVNAVPECFRQGNGNLLQYSETASFWLNNRVSNACYKMYNQMEPFVRKSIDKFENGQLSEVQSLDEKAMNIYKGSRQDKTAAIKKMITDYSVKTADKMFKEWKKLEVVLLVKFIDGNVKAQDAEGNFIHSKYSKSIPDSLKQPGYTDFWKKAVATEHGRVVEVRK